ncbi:MULTISPECIES: hypothetical protein [unclassified Bradyrhizobium]|uniref:hypothetical protein n=1 Tax=unclassified Bradyrhizobium TaxID=2631580 RepID=UPI00247858C5|nr:MULTISPECIES: hypothetical protein [unclassified Bradyrhizobium]WGR71428.1 hypothetical protein MTX24_00195 [Bradyrhizobium sp. ISRA426]WGR76263.1 hypothetical protein MTX21_25145 [Bradyrhizobium sp. ISRA430]WGR86668.1 hypothetical protein MTX25_00195 [Bradyrhizobium sp. ISRA432]
MNEALLERAGKSAAKSPSPAAMGLVREGGKRYISANLIFSYDPRNEGGPERTRSFLLPERGLAGGVRPDGLLGPKEVRTSL